MLLSYLGSCLENSEVSHLVIIPNKFIYDLFSLKDKFMHINSPLSEMTGTNQCHTIINELSIVFKGEMGKILCHQEPDWRASKFDFRRSFNSVSLCSWPEFPETFPICHFWMNEQFPWGCGSPALNSLGEDFLSFCVKSKGLARKTPPTSEQLLC